jgi:DNA-binding transcriptional MocR family regulator
MGSRQLVRLLGSWTRGGDGSLHTQLAEQMRHLIATGAIPASSRLPSERSLAAALDISRNTVAKAFDALRGEGLIASRQGDGSYTSGGVRHVTPRGDDRLESFVSSEVDERKPSSAIDLRSAALPGLSMVATELSQLDSARVLALIGSHGYLPSGLRELREAIAEYYTGLGLPTEAEHILVTSGAQQALRLSASLFVQRDSTVVIEEPSFRGAIESLHSLGARLVGVPSGVDGVDVNALQATVARTHPALIVVQSTVHNPTGSVMDSFRRSRVASIAKRFSVPVIDDATLADTIIDGDRRPLPLAVGNDSIVTVGSTSKSFWGGLRVGWVRAAPELIDELTAMKGSEDLGTSILAQLLASQLLPKIERASDERRAVLSESRGLALDALAALLPDWTPQMPAGGASLWIKLPTGNATAFTQRAERAGVLLLPGPTFSSSDRMDDYLRLAFAASPDYTARGIETLARTWESFSQN